MVLNNRYRFVFIHIPKVAGSSLRDAFHKLPGTDRSAVSRVTKHETYMEFCANYPGRTGKTDAVLSTYLPIAFVRNPWDRFASFHAYLLLHPKKWDATVPESINEFAALALGGASQPRDIRSLKTQVEFLRGGPPGMFVGRFETLELNVQGLEAILGVRLQVQKRNQGKYSEQGGVAAMSEKTRNLVGNWFSDDCRHFGYKEP